MSKHLHNEIEKLKKKILFIGAMVEEALQKAVKAVLTRDENLAAAVIENDEAIDTMEVELEEDCLKVLALYQPVATDLRYIVAILKINNELERIGDLAGNVAGRAEALAPKERLPVPYDLAGMAEEVRKMLKDCLDALVNLDAELADSVCRADDKVDIIHRQTFTHIMDAIRHDLEHIDSYINLLSISRYLERIADHTTNIAQDVIYLLKGDIVRHRGREIKARLETGDKSRLLPSS
jgi:phosphate transport system protein